ncbi:MAG TPA: sulfite exporter TauE/SafE family protein, partial [Gemmatimonadales bacterium]|nr:sulfite exporter TauE/SafE family protein [Gemmatimonadales bacterium]
FFDTLGIGSYAPTTAMYKFWQVVPDERIPGTLTVGHALATITQAFIFMALVQVDAVTLALMIGSAVAGAWLGAGVVAAWPRRNIQIGMGLALLVAATLFTFANLDLMPGGGTALGLGGLKLGVGLSVNFLLGALMTIGIGLYAPCMILVSLLGMDPKAAFPIMMGSCAFLMPVSSVKFLRVNSYSIRPALGLLLGGVPAVLIAAFIVKSLPLTTVRWLVVVVVLYSASMMLRSAWKERSR